MTFTLLPDLTVFLIGFVLLAAAACAVLLGAAASFFVANHDVRVRRHEGLFDYYGHLALGR